MSYETESEIAELLRKFEDASIARDRWTHKEHLVAALHYVNGHDFDEAYRRMRSGIFKLLTEGFGVDLEKEMPYNETITVFWMKTVADFNASKNGMSLLDKTNEIVEKYDKDYPLRFYTRELLFSAKARENFIEGDLQNDFSEIADS